MLLVLCLTQLVIVIWLGVSVVHTGAELRRIENTKDFQISLLHGRLSSVASDVAELQEELHLDAE